jgi:hypothetical protein
MSRREAGLRAVTRRSRRPGASPRRGCALARGLSRPLASTLSACSVNIRFYYTYFIFIEARRPRGQCASTCDRGSSATLVSLCMGEQKFIILSSFGRYFKPLVPAAFAFAVFSTHKPALGPRGGSWPVLLMSNPSSGDINRLMMIIYSQCYYNVYHNIMKNMLY